MVHPAKAGEREGKRLANADDQSIDSQAAQGSDPTQQGASITGMSAKARGVYPSLHYDPEKAELGPAQGCARASYKRL